jgi:hypothetical protein
MKRDVAFQMSLTTRLELLSFTSLFFAFATIDLIHELHNLGHPVLEILLRSLLTAALTAGALHVFSNWKRPSE